MITRRSLFGYLASIPFVGLLTGCCPKAKGEERMAKLKEATTPLTQFTFMSEQRIPSLHIPNEDGSMTCIPLNGDINMDIDIEVYYGNNKHGVRLWTMVDSKAGLLPTKGAVDKLSNMLANNIGEGMMDLIWGPDLKMTESKDPNEVHHIRNGKYTGSTKFRKIPSEIPPFIDNLKKVV